MKRELSGIGFGNDDHSPSPEQGLSAIRIVSAAVGLIVILVGLGYTVRLLNAAFRVLGAPDGAAPAVTAWAEALGGESLNIVVPDHTYPGARVAAMLALGGGAVFLGWLATTVMAVGARIIVWTTTDREAVRQVLLYALGKNQLQVDEHRDAVAEKDKVIDRL